MKDVRLLREIAHDQGGVFTVAQAKACGWSHHGVLGEVSSQRWRRLHPGVLVEREWLTSLPPRDRHLAHVHARLLHRPQGWHAARRSAAVVLGLPLLGAIPGVPQLVRDKTAGSLRGHTRHERIAPLPRQDRDVRGSVPVTAMSRTVVDLARQESFRSAVVTADAALRAGTSPEELAAVLARCSGWPGARAARLVVEFASPLAESVLESLSRVAVHELELPVPELQTEIWHDGAFVARVDFLWRHERVVGEADGRAKYATVEDLYEEKRREERLRDLGLEVVRWDWEAAMHPRRRLDAALRRAFERGLLNTLAPGVALRSQDGSSARLVA